MLLHGRLSILSKLFLNYSATVSVAVLSAFKESAAAGCLLVQLQELLLLLLRLSQRYG